MAKRPNILVITTHDTGRHFGCYGVRTVHTPAIDALAARGVKCTNYFAAVPICCASRASMMTGRYPQSHGLLDLFFPPFDWEMHPEERHLSEILRDAGYTTHLFFMQHETGNVARLGFDRLWAQESRLHAGRYPAADEVAGEVANFLENEAEAGQPFYAQVGFFETHSPFDFGGVKPDTSRGVFVPSHLKSNPMAIDLMAGIQGAVRKVDEAVAVIVDALDRSGLADDTILIFTVDHGLEIPRAKWTLYDPGIEIAFVVKWPNGGIAGGRECDWLLSNVDFTPTVLELASLPVPANVQGRSFARGLRGEKTSPSREEVFGYYLKTESRCVRTKRHKLIQNFVPPGSWTNFPVDMNDASRNRIVPPVELYDLVADPREFNNVAERPEYADVRRDLSARLWNWMESVNDPILRGLTVTPYYNRAMSGYRTWKNP